MPTSLVELQRVIAEYEVEIVATDIIDPKDLRPLQQGLFAEVGGIMAASKKLVREKSAFPGHKKAVEEEFGDTFWYLAAVCRRLSLPLSELLEIAGAYVERPRMGQVGGLVRQYGSMRKDSFIDDEVDSTLVELGGAAARLLESAPDFDNVLRFTRRYLSALDASNLLLSKIVQANLRKARGAFVWPAFDQLIDFDEDFKAEEQLPRRFRIRLNQRPTGKSYLQWNGVFIGDPLTDNIGDPDCYRFHDVFHFAHAAVLHWSPVMRAMIKQKRKSRGGFDDEQDGGRAIVVEEGLTAWIFSRAKDLEYFAGQSRVSLDILKTIGEFVAGYEVERCPLKLWENAVLQGYNVFRQVKAQSGGYVVGDRVARTLAYEPLETL